jgi:hypothetical protein
VGLDYLNLVLIVLYVLFLCFDQKLDTLDFNLESLTLNMIMTRLDWIRMGLI